MAGVRHRGGAHVYVVIDGNLSKIGRSSYPQNRLVQLQGKNFKHRRMTFCSEKRGDAVLVEGRAHQILAAFVVPPGHEWFAVSAEDAEAAIRQAIEDVESGWRFSREMFPRFLPVNEKEKRWPSRSRR